MHTLVLSAVLFHTVGTMVIMLGMAVKACLPERRVAQTWELSDADAAVASAKVQVELPRAA